MKSQILKLRKQIYKNLKNKALELETRSHELDQYLEDQNKMASRDFQIIDIQKIQSAILDTNIIYLGDFHTFDQNIRNVLRILKFIINNNRKCILGLEMIHADCQQYIDAYLDNHLTDLEFLDSINYHNSWKFPWTHYKLIFELAKEHNIKVVGLNTTGTLNQRDKYAATILQKIHSEDSEIIQFVLYGELHITNNKIPAVVKMSTPKIKHVIIHQNLDEVYWKLIEKNKETGIVEFNPQEFCLISAPPWIKYESMIYWYENLCDDPDFDIHEYIIENGKKTFSEDTQDQFYNLCLELNLNLNLSLKNEHIENFNIYDHTNLEFIEDQLEASLNKENLTFFEYLISSGQSFKIPNSNTFYCSSYSMNRMAYLAGAHIFYIFFSKKNLENDFNKENYFNLHLLQSMFSYFFSKIINPHRKCDMYQDLISEKQNTQNIFVKKYLNLSIKTLANLEVQKVDCYSLPIIHEAAQLIGHIMGEYLYQKTTISQTTLSTKDLLENIQIKSKYINKKMNDIIDVQNYKQHIKRTF